MAAILRVRTTLNYIQGGPGLHTAYFSPATVGGVTADATACVAGVRAFWDAIKGLFVNSFTAQVQSDVAQVENTTGVLLGQLSATPVAIVTGTVAGSYSPIASMMLLRLRSNAVINGRLLRGRWYLGPVSNTVVDSSGRLGPAQQTTLTNAGNVVAAGFAGCIPIIWHRPSPTGVGQSGTAQSFSAAADMAVLRSRRDA